MRYLARVARIRAKARVARVARVALVARIRAKARVARVAAYISKALPAARQSCRVAARCRACAACVAMPRSVVIRY